MPRHAVLPSLTYSMLLWLGAMPALAGGVSGRITDDAGHALAGVFVTAQDAASHIETTVYSEADGRYLLPALAPGHYNLRAHHPRFDDAGAEFDIGQNAVSHNLSLRAAADALRHASTATWFAKVPDGAEKREFILNCMSCHEIAYGRIMKDGAPRTRQQWLDAFALMKSFDKYAVIPPDFDVAHYADWLTSAFNAESVKHVPLPALASPAAPAEITEYPVPIASELPHDLVVGPDHRIWVTAFWNSLMWALDPATGRFEAFEVNDQPKVPAQVRALTFAEEARCGW